MPMSANIVGILQTGTETHLDRAALPRLTAPQASWAPQYLLVPRTSQEPGPTEEASE